MPAALAAAANYIAAAFYSAAAYAGASAAAAAAFAVVATNALAYATNAFLLNAAMRALQKRGKTGETRGMEVSVTDSTADGAAIYGLVRVGGVNMIPPYTSGNEGRYLHQVLALAVHECHAFGDVYFNQTEIPDSSIGAVSGGSSDGLVTGGDYDAATWIRRYLGTTTQNVDYILNAAFPTQWPSTSRGRGWTYAAMQYDWGNGKKWTGGVPQATFEVYGARVYDPRLDSTNGGSGSHRYTTPSTWAWSNNPALCWAHFRCADFGYGNDPATDINWAKVATAADRCDALVTTPAGNKKRYTFNARINLGGDPADNERAIVDAMMGHVTPVNGQWNIYAGGWEAPSHTINKTDWLSIEEITVTASRNDDRRYNGVRCFYVDPARNWQRVECYPRTNAGYMSADAGERIWIEMEQPGCTDEHEAQRKSEFLLRASRNGVSVVGTLPPRFQKIATFETVTVVFAELGWPSGKTFRVSAMDLRPDGSVLVALTEEQDTDWTDLLVGEYNTPSIASVPTIEGTKPTGPLDFGLTVNGDSILASWAEPAVKPVGTRYRILFYPASLSAVSSKQVAWEGDALNANLKLAVNSNLWYQVQAYVGSHFSQFNPNTFGIGVAAVITPPAAPSGLWQATLNPLTLSKNGATATLTTGNASVSINSPVSPTFAWTRVYSVEAFAVNSTGSTTAFRATNMADPEFRNAQFRVTVIDGANSVQLGPVDVGFNRFNYS